MENRQIVLRWTKIWTGFDGINFPVWHKTTTDLLGHPIRTEHPGFGGVTLATENT